jgi:hypothetical protein
MFEKKMDRQLSIVFPFISAPSKGDEHCNSDLCVDCAGRYATGRLLLLSYMHSCVLSSFVSSFALLFCTFSERERERGQPFLAFQSIQACIPEVLSCLPRCSLHLHPSTHSLKHGFSGQHNPRWQHHNPRWQHHHSRAWNDASFMADVQRGSVRCYFTAPLLC